MKPLTYILAGLLIALQYPLWIGKGSWMRVWDLDRQLLAQKDGNGRAKARNEALEERARFELGMIRKDETFYQVVPGR